MIACSSHSPLAAAPHGVRSQVSAWRSLVFICMLLLVSGVWAQEVPQGNPLWTLQSKGRVMLDSSIVRLADVVIATSIPVEHWESLGNLVVGLLPPDGRGMALDRQRLAEVVAVRLPEGVSVRWTGPLLIALQASPNLDRESDRPATNSSARQTSQPVKNDQDGVVRRADFQSEPSVFTARRIADSAAQRPHDDQAEANAEPAAAPATSMEVILVSARTLRRGEVLSAGDLEEQIVAPEKVPVDSIRELDDFVGKQMRYSVAKGRPVFHRDVAEPTVVGRGDLVELQVLGGGIVIRTAARTLQPGALGDLIMVETQEPRRRLMAKVLSGSAVAILTRPPQTSGD